MASADRGQPPLRERRFERLRAVGSCLCRAALPLMTLSLSVSPASAAEPDGVVAGPERVEPLTWRAPPGCGSAAAVRARVSELLDEPELAFGDVQVDARVSETTGGWTLQLLTRDALGTRDRELAAESCGDLVEAAALSITLVFEAARAREDEPPSAEITPPSQAPSALDSAAEAPPAPASETTTTASAGAELVIDLSSLAAVAAGPSLFAALGWDALSVGLHATWLPGVDEAVGPAQAVEVSLLAAGLRLCYALGRGLLDTAVCAGLDAGQLTARGAGLRESRVVHDPWLSTQAGLALSRELGSGFALQGRGELVVPLLRQTYGINETEAVYRVASLSARFAIGARLAF